MGTRGTLAQSRRKAKEARMQVIAKLYVRGYSIRQLRDEVMKRLDLKTYSTKTVHDDVHSLLDEWRKNRLDDMNKALQLELERIDDTVRELWEQWEKSKENYTASSTKRKGKVKDGKETDGGSQDGKVKPYAIEEFRRDVQRLGNPAYIAEIRQQLAERRKLLGLYAPEKKDVTGGISFTSFLVESGMLDEAERSTADKGK